MLNFFFILMFNHFAWFQGTVFSGSVLSIYVLMVDEDQQGGTVVHILPCRSKHVTQMWREKGEKRSLGTSKLMSPDTALQ